MVDQLDELGEALLEFEQLNDLTNWLSLSHEAEANLCLTGHDKLQYSDPKFPT